MPQTTRQRYADPTRCPDCQHALGAAPTDCPSCRLPLDVPETFALFDALTAADGHLDALRALRARREAEQAVPVEAPVEVPVDVATSADPAAWMPAFSYADEPAAPAPQAPRRAGVSGASVPRILFGLAVASLLVGAMVFMAVTWDRLGTSGQTAVLLLVPAAAAGGSLAAARRRLRGAAESLVTVTAGLACLDALGAVSAGWLGDGLGAAGTGLTVSATLAVVALVLLVAHRSERLPRLVAPQLGVAVGATGVVWSSCAVPSGSDAQTLTAAGGVVLLALAGAGLARVSARVGAAVTHLAALVTAGVVGAVAVVTLSYLPDVSDWASTGGLWTVLLAVAAAVVAVVPTYPVPVRVVSTASAAVALTLALTGPLLPVSLTSFVLTTAAAALLLGLTGLPGPVSRGPRVVVLGLSVAAGAWALLAAALPALATVAIGAEYVDWASLWDVGATATLVASPGTPGSGSGVEAAALLLVAPALVLLTAAVLAGSCRVGLLALPVLAAPVTAWTLVAPLPLVVPVVGWSLAALALTFVAGRGRRVWLLGAVAGGVTALVLAAPSAGLSALAAAVGGVVVLVPLLGRLEQVVPGPGAALVRGALLLPAPLLAAWAAGAVGAVGAGVGAAAVVAVALVSVAWVVRAPVRSRAVLAGAVLAACASVAGAAAVGCWDVAALLTWTCAGVALGALVGVAALGRALDGRFTVLGAAPAATGAVLLLLEQSTAVLGTRPFSGVWTDRLPSAEATTIATLPLLGVALLLSTGVPAVVEHGLRVSLVRHRAVLGGAVAALVGLAVLGLGLPLVAVVAGLVVVTAATAVLGGSAVARSVALVPAVPALAVALPSQLLTALALTTLAGIAAAVAVRSREAERVAAACVSFALVAAAGPAWWTLVGAPLRWATLPVLVAAALLTTVGAVRRRVAVPLEATAALATTVVAGLALDAAADEGLLNLVAAVHLAVGGAVLAGHALSHPDRRALGWMASVMLAASTWLRLWEAGVTAPEAYTLPSAVGLLLVGLHRLRTEPTATTRLALGPGLWLATVPSLLATWPDPLSGRALLLGTACLVLVMLGVRLRWSQPLVVGAVVGAVLVAREAAPWIGAGPQWVPFVLAGLVLLWVAITWESRLGDARRAAAYVGRLR